MSEEGGEAACWAHLQVDDGADVVDLAAAIERLDEPMGDGVHWALQGGADLNANLVRLEPGHEMAEHRNDELDVLLVGLAGAGVLRVGARTVPLRPSIVALVPRGEDRSVQAGAGGLAYLTVHRRRAGLSISPRP